MQTFLDLNSTDEDILISNENIESFKLLKNKKKFLIIVGPEKSGKSKLAKKFANLHNIELINDIPHNLKFKNDTYLDLNKLPTNEESFFHFLQYFIANDISLTIFTSSSPFSIDTRSKAVPDILSRLKSFNISNIEQPQDDLLFKLIQKFLKFKSISVSDNIIECTMNYINRTYVDALNASETINNLLYQNNHNINLSLIKQYYE